MQAGHVFQRAPVADVQTPPGFTPENGSDRAPPPFPERTRGGVCRSPGGKSGGFPLPRPAMSDWIGRLASIAAIAAAGALLTGWLLGPVFSSLFLFAYFIAVVAIGLRARVRLAKWLPGPSPPGQAPRRRPGGGN